MKKTKLILITALLSISSTSSARLNCGIMNADPNVYSVQQISQGSLARYAPDSWASYFYIAATTGLPHSTFREDYSLLQNVPQSVKDMFFENLPDLYTEAYRYKNLASLEMNPKRSIDALLRIFLRGDKIVTDAIDNGSDPKDAYLRYLRKIKDLMKDSGFSNYQPEDIFTVALELKGALRSMKEKLKQIKNWDITKPTSLTITGSFPNGLANIDVADVDISPSDEYLNNFSKEIQEAIDRAFKKLKREKSPFFGLAHGKTEGFFALTNPFMIRVTEDSVFLLVWPLPLTTEWEDTYLIGGIYPTPPHVYRLF